MQKKRKPKLKMGSNGNTYLHPHPHPHPHLIQIDFLFAEGELNNYRKIIIKILFCYVLCPPKADLIIFIVKGKAYGRRKNGTCAVFA